MAKILSDKEDLIVIRRKDGTIIKVYDGYDWSPTIEMVTGHKTMILGEDGVSIRFSGGGKKNFDFRDMFRVNRLIRRSPPDSELRKAVYGGSEESMSTTGKGR